MLIMLILLVTFRIAVTSIHSREELYRLRPYTTSTSQFRPPFNHLYRGMAYRGCRAGKWVKEKRDNLLINIPIAGSRCRSRNVNKLHDNTKSIDNLTNLNNIGYIVCIHIITQSDFALFDREVAMFYFSGKQFGITITIFIKEKYEKISDC